jgi:hypothetical protein
MWWTSLYPIHAQVQFAAMWGFGGINAAKLTHTTVGLIAVAGVTGAGCLLGGRTAGVVAGVLFAALPLTLWELGARMSRCIQ